eukprot:10783322-Alexandrium_andersonii.AAC.1
MIRSRIHGRARVGIRIGAIPSTAKVASRNTVLTSACGPTLTRLLDLEAQPQGYRLWKSKA